MSYNTNVPQSGQSLGETQSIINTNFSVLNTAFSVNHTALSAAGQGKHPFLQMPEQGSAPATAAAEAAIYAQSASGSNLFIRNNTNGQSYQLTRMIDASIARFGAIVEYDAGPPSLKGGWTFLPGNLLLQYGSVTNVAKSGTNTTVTFPVSFTNPPIMVNVTPEKPNSSPTSDNMYVRNASITTSQFVIVNSDSSARIGYWIAIGV